MRGQFASYTMSSVQYNELIKACSTKEHRASMRTVIAYINKTWGLLFTIVKINTI